ncbi:hypothetical protein CROQUDRAFT_664129 [Cronartium quercuum f. sp. fusiforme G11]|uniref:Uncharacterized protein n=1 Tax=Cronartium quercuum f. sp. fusiforme G11 TaxID=708437 RepID=A0A9P6NC00_9BASI|nr:hypothetical protein CROQUDRAFT_664129 [Cronartium quercuum f. sp. fusiforme G11]
MTSLITMSQRSLHTMLVFCSDPKGFKGGCGFFAWLEVYLSQCAIENVPIIVTLLPTLWRKIRSIPSTPTSPFLGFFQSGGLRMLW